MLRDDESGNQRESGERSETGGRRLRVWVGRLLALVAGLVLADFSLRLAGAVSPAVHYQLSPPWVRNLVADPTLGHRMSPFYPGHDERGFRNESAPRQTEILVLGDSLVYGYGAAAEDSWPRQLAAKSATRVYNAGIGGHGPPEYMAVLEELQGLEPDLVMVGLYLGNDIGGAYKSVYLDGRFEELASQDPAVLAALAKRDARGTLKEMAVARGESRRPTMQTALNRISLPARVSTLYQLGQSVRHTLAQSLSSPLRQTREDTFEAASQRPLRLPFDSIPELRTVFPNPKLSALPLDLSDPRILEGWRITRDVLLRMRAALEERDSTFAVVLLHTKLAAYADLIAEVEPGFSPSYFATVEMERALAATIVDFLQQNEIAYVETVDQLATVLASTTMAFHESDDGHPNAVGYAAIAEALIPLVERRDW